MSIAAKLAVGLVSILAMIAMALVAKPAPTEAVTIDRSPDCDKYAVIYCGSFTKQELINKMNNGDGRNSSSNIKSIFNQFGISVSRIQGDTFVKGVVYQNGEVKVNGKVVATNAQTYIRHLGGKGPTSRMGSAQEALVRLDSSGKFEYAVMTPCGNPVTGKPVEPPKPQSLSCDSLTVTIISKKDRKIEAHVKGSASNTTITGYKIDFGDGSSANQQKATHTYSNYGKYTITGYVIGKVNGSNKVVTSKACTKHVEFNKPPEPEKQTLICTALKIVEDKETRTVKATVTGEATNTTIDAYKIDFGDGTVVNEQTAEHTYDYGQYTIIGHVTGVVDGETVTKTSADCKKYVKYEKPTPKPEHIVCDVIKVNILDKKARKVEAKVSGSAQNTTIDGYKIDFGDGTVVNEQTATHTYDDYGKYTITGYVTGIVDGERVTVTDEPCIKHVEFNKPPEPKEELLVCDLLDLVDYNNDKRYVKFTVYGTAENTTIDGYKIDFGDGEVVDAQTASHTYSGWGEYEVTGYVSGIIDGEMVQVSGPGCKQTVKFKEKVDPCPTNPSLPINHPDCKPCPYNPDLNYDDPYCKAPEVPEELPNTGAGALISMVSGVSILGALGHRFFIRRF